ncbi:methyl-accepting chemotaxis protein [Hydrogenophaga pseudoflava]|uniref:methyl-accepting chemotaxis protein n=1 Tax=Hydrogenophaga pseudoflava TaxID=47421 RepID=UPI0027E5A932|nr:methyl-accepting chemotaxis protein [Hydrogenophaga pseudoflava]MDQ7746669.1 methyl-accepting chemotaxis protein [Hydrogenophaga pseudoflava]
MVYGGITPAGYSASATIEPPQRQGRLKSPGHHPISPFVHRTTRRVCAANSPGSPMYWLSKISVRTKLLLLMAICTSGILGVAGAGWYSLNHAVQTSQALVESEVTAVRSLGGIRASIGNMRRYEKDLFLNLADEAVLAKYEQSWKGQVVETRKLMDHIHPLLRPDEQAALQRMQAGITAYSAAVEKIIVGIQRGEVNDPWRANQLMEPSKADIRAADSALAEIGTSVEERVNAAVAGLANLQQRASALMMVFALAVVFIAAGFGYVISRRITVPLQAAVDAIERVSRGDLSHPLVHAGEDETARVLAGISRMQGSLKSIVGEIRQGVVSMTEASTEIASGNADLSRRTESTAASLEETAASMDEIAGAMQHSSSAAGQARHMVETAKETAARGGQAMGRVVDTMHEINASSQRISDIVSVIDGIAFQTNILALNAAVESARAGEHGRGFAVVANEVRTLAKRSADAAKEIKALISESVDRVESGSRLVEQAGATMNEIVVSVDRVTGIITDIASSAGEQNLGVQQIHTAINQLDQMTQQNSALVEQSSAAAESLLDQAAKLEGRVAVFKLA